MNPYPGQMVMVFADPAHANGADEAPAVITRVWTAGMASVRIFHDGPCSPECTDRATVLLYASREEALAVPRREGLLPSGAWPLPLPAPGPGPVLAGFGADLTALPHLTGQLAAAGA